MPRQKNGQHKQNLFFLIPHTSKNPNRSSSKRSSRYLLDYLFLTWIENNGQKSSVYGKADRQGSAVGLHLLPDLRVLRYRNRHSVLFRYRNDHLFATGNQKHISCRHEPDCRHADRRFYRYGRSFHHPGIQYLPAADAAISADLVLHSPVDDIAEAVKKNPLSTILKKRDLKKLLSVAPLFFLADFMRKSALTNITCVAFLSVTITHGADSSISSFAFNRILDTLIGVFVSFFINVIPLGHPDKQITRDTDVHVE